MHLLFQRFPADSKPTKYSLEEIIPRQNFSSTIRPNKNEVSSWLWLSFGFSWMLHDGNMCLCDPRRLHEIQQCREPLDKIAEILGSYHSCDGFGSPWPWRHTSMEPSGGLPSWHYSQSSTNGFKSGLESFFSRLESLRFENDYIDDVESMTSSFHLMYFYSTKRECGAVSTRAHGNPYFARLYFA